MADKPAPTIEEALLVLDVQMNNIESEMSDNNMPAVSIAYANRVLRPAYDLMIRAHHNKTPIPDLDEAIVATIASIIDDYLTRVHAKGQLNQAISHLSLVLEDVAERTTQQIDAKFTDRSIIVARH